MSEQLWVLAGDVERLTAENARLKAEVERLRALLMEATMARGMAAAQEHASDEDRNVCSGMGFC